MGLGIVSHSVLLVTPTPCRSFSYNISILKLAGMESNTFLIGNGYGWCVPHSMRNMCSTASNVSFCLTVSLTEIE